MIKKIDFLKKIDGRSMLLFKHIGLSSLYKAGTILISLILVPLSINYLGSSQYGLWLTLFSFLGWFNIVDFGIGNGLRNKLAQALSIGDINLAKEYVSTAYVVIICISLLVFILFITIFPFVHWDSVFNFSANNNSIEKLIFISFMIFSVNLTLKNINVIYYADQKSSLPEFFNFIGQLVILVEIYIIMQFTHESLFVYGSIVLATQMIILLLSTLISFFGKYKFIFPSIKYYKKKHIKEIFGIGIKFFVLQISSILIISTDTFIINLYLGSSSVTIYSIPYKYFMLAITIMTIIANPYWSAFTQAFSENDNAWMQKSIKMLSKISILITILIIFMIVIANKIYLLWVGSSIEIPFLLTLIIGLNTIIRVFIYPIVMFLNGTGKVQIELYLGATLAIINIPLSIFLATNMHLGIYGVVLATLMITVVELAILPIQVKKIIKKNAKGIWNA